MAYITTARLLQNPKLLSRFISHTTAPFNSIRIDLSTETCNPTDLQAYLSAHLQTWTVEKKNAIWAKLNMNNHGCLPVLQEQGFQFHSAIGQHVTLTRWLPTDVPNKIPPFATHQVGVAGVCLDAVPLDSTRSIARILTVRERNSRPGQPPFWKFPGGLADRGEDFGATAVRETFEETGVRSTFHSMLSFRHQHGLGYEGRVSDIYALCLVLPDRQQFGDDAVKISIDEAEIAEAAWMDPWQYIATVKHPLNRYVAALALQEAGRLLAGQGKRMVNDAGLEGPTDAHTLLSETQGGAAAARAAASEAAGRSGVAEDRVYIPQTGKWVKAYRASSGPSIANKPQELPAAAST